MFCCEQPDFGPWRGFWTSGEVCKLWSSIRFQAWFGRKMTNFFFRPTLFSQLYPWNKKTKQSYTLECFVASSPILAHGEASGRLQKFANFGHRSGFRHDMRCLSAYDKTKNWTNGVELVAKTFLLKCDYAISSFFWWWFDGCSSF